MADGAGPYTVIEVGEDSVWVPLDPADSFSQHTTYEQERIERVEIVIIEKGGGVFPPISGDDTYRCLPGEACLFLRPLEMDSGLSMCQAGDLQNLSRIVRIDFGACVLPPIGWIALRPHAMSDSRHRARLLV